MAKSSDYEIVAAYTPSPPLRKYVFDPDKKELVQEQYYVKGGLTLLFPPSSEFNGEVPGDSHPVIIEYVSRRPSWLADEDESDMHVLGGIPKEDVGSFDSIKPDDLGRERYFVEENEGDPRESKLFPTDILMKTGGESDKEKWENEEKDVKRTLQTLRRLLAEIRVTNSPGEASEEQAKAMDAFKPGINPILNFTGRPGTGKTTVAHVHAAEGSLTPNRDLNILYLTTTSALKSEASDEIRAIVEKVYECDEELTKESLSRIKILTRDDLIQELPQKDRRLDSARVAKLLADLSEEIDSGQLALDKPEGARKALQRWKEMEDSEELFQIIQNFVFGIFGSITKFKNWFENSPDRCNFKQADYRGWSEIFIHGRRWNFIDPDNDGLSPGKDQFPLYRVWNPYDSEGFPKLSQQEIKNGYEKIRDLYILMSIKSFSSNLFDETLSGNWTHAGVLDYLANIAENKRADEERDKVRLQAESTAAAPLATAEKQYSAHKRFNTHLWRAMQNKFDVIIFDESQDFSIRELACVLKIFARRGSGNLEDAYRPFALVCAGDPLQTVEGTLFNGRNSHINAVYEDWKQHLSLSESDRGLRNPIHLELKSNYRNSKMIVDNVLNPIIRKMNEYDKRTISEQRAAFNRHGLIQTVSEADVEITEDEGDSPRSLAYRIALDRLHTQLEECCKAKVSKEPTVIATVALIMPKSDISDLDKLKRCLDKNGIWEYKNQESSEKRSIGELVNDLLEGNDYSDKDKKSTPAYYQALGRAGIYDIEGIKGRTVSVAIALEFAQNAIDALERGSSAKSLLSLSHLLVASSRPQYALFIHGPEGLDLTPLNIDLEHDQQLDATSVKRLIADSTVDYNPSGALSLALSSAFKDPRGNFNGLFWEFAMNAAEGAGKGEEFVKLARNIHRSYSDGELSDLIDMLEDMEDDGGRERKIMDSAEEIDQGSCWVIDDDEVDPDIGPETTRRQLITFFGWKNFVEERQTRVKLEQKSLKSWVDWVKKPDIHSAAELIGSKESNDRWNFSPFYFKDSDSIREAGYDDSRVSHRAQRARRDDCSLSCKVPPRWVFGDMVMEGVYTPEYEHFKKMLQFSFQARMKKVDSNKLKSILTGKWFLACSQLEQEIQAKNVSGAENRNDLRDVAEEAIRSNMGVEIVDWMLECIKDEEDFDAAIFREMIHWCSDKEDSFYDRFREAFVDYISNMDADGEGDWIGSLLELAGLMCCSSGGPSSRKNIRKYGIIGINPDVAVGHLTDFWTSVTDEEAVVELAEKHYKNLLIEIENTLELDRRGMERIQKKLENLHEAMHSFQPISNEEHLSDTKRGRLTLRVKSIFKMIDGLLRSSLEGRVSGANPDLFSLQHQRHLAEYDYETGYSLHEEWKVMMHIFKIWMKGCKGGEFGSPAKNLRAKTSNIIESLLNPIRVEVLEKLEARRNKHIQEQVVLYLQELNDFGRKQCNYYFERLYKDSISPLYSGGIEYPLLKFIVGISGYVEARKRSKGAKGADTWERIDKIYQWEDVDVLSELNKRRRVENPRSRWDPTSMYRESNNFWNYINDSKFPASRRNRIEIELGKIPQCTYNGLKWMPPNFNDNAVTLIKPDGVVFDRFARVPMASVSDKGSINPFCNNNAGIVAHNLSWMKLSSNSNFSESDLVEIRSLFRRSGSYREAAVVDLVLFFLGYRDQKDMVKMAIEERAGVFHDQVLVDSNWTDKDNGNGDSLPDSLTSRFSLKLEEGRLIPSVSSPVGSVTDLKLLRILGENHIDEEVNKLRLESNHRKAIDVVRHLQMILKVERGNMDEEEVRKEVARLSQVVVNLTYSTRSLLPYLLLSEEVQLGDRINEIQWFDTPRKLPQVSGVAIANIPRSVLISEIDEQDPWLSALYDIQMSGKRIDEQVFLKLLRESESINLSMLAHSYLDIDLQEEAGTEEIAMMPTAAGNMQQVEGETCVECEGDIGAAIMAGGSFCNHCGARILGPLRE